MITTANPSVTGIILAAGAGTRAGGPKALARTLSGVPWLAIASTVLFEAGCSRVLAVLGAQEQRARALLPAQVEVVVAQHWQRGVSESLRTGLAAASGEPVLVTLVDLPELPVSVARRVLAGTGELRQAMFDGRPGHPVYLSARHGMLAQTSLVGDSGARHYLTAHNVTEIDCADLWDGLDRDTAQAGQ
ncbi:MAG: nucleotidyltransferase family protein [Rhodoglobus sp.]